MSFAYLPFYTGDYFRDTRGLSMAGHGCYVLLLTYCWDSQGPLPLDEERIAGICEARSQEERTTMGKILVTYFTRMADGWYQSRMQREIEKAAAISIARKSAGAKGYQAKAKHLPGKSKAKAKQVPLPNTIPTKEKPSVANAKIAFATEGGWLNVSDRDRKAWTAAYPAIDIDAELAKAWVWADSHDKKQQWKRFLTGWMGRAQKEAPTTAKSYGKVI